MRATPTNSSSDEIAVARGAREALVQLLDAPLLHADLGHDLLREHVERRAAAA